mmetsp:Transcript_33338/g.105659  ORF Transcript_33338/g.105659 Transcript_33338/m.105659 type:complete len:245 (+) Transcript_33338:88-822(+)
MMAWSRPTETICLPSGLNDSFWIVRECPTPLDFSMPAFTSQTLTMRPVPQLARYLSSGERLMLFTSSSRLIVRTGSAILKSHWVIVFSWPPVITVVWFEAMAKQLMPPCFSRWEVSLFSVARSHVRRQRSRPAEMAYWSFGKSWTSFTRAACSFKCEAISLVRYSHTRTSPSAPPVTTNLDVDASFTDVTPPLWALSICQRYCPCALSKDMSLPSLQPVTRTSALPATEMGYARVLVEHRKRAL